MEKRSLQIDYDYYNGPDELELSEKALFLKSREVLKQAYAPYSRFHVGCAVELVNGEIITGVNQENAAFPSGFCAEMTALGRAGSSFPGVGVKRIAVCCNSLDFEVNYPVSPCGSCRQVMNEWETRYGKNLRIIFGGFSGPVVVVNAVADILPFGFKATDFKHG